MDNNHPSKQSLSHSFRVTVNHLFFPEKDPFYIFLILGVITLIGLVLRILEINKAIAYDLGISSRTIEVHRDEVCVRIQEENQLAARTPVVPLEVFQRLLRTKIA